MGDPITLALIGTALGAGTGQLIGGNTESTLLGAGAGGLTGGLGGAFLPSLLGGGGAAAGGLPFSLNMPGGGALEAFGAAPNPFTGAVPAASRLLGGLPLPSAAGGGINPQALGLFQQALGQATSPDAQLAKMLEAMMSRQPVPSPGRQSRQSFTPTPVPSPSAILRSPMGFRF